MYTTQTNDLMRHAVTVVENVSSSELWIINTEMLYIKQTKWENAVMTQFKSLITRCMYHRFINSIQL